MRWLIAAGFLVALPVATQGQETWTDEDTCGHARMAARWLERDPGLQPGDLVVRDGEVTDTDVLHYDLDLEIDPVTESLSGSNIMTVRSLIDGLTQFCFQLDDNFAITSLMVNGNSVSWVHPDGVNVDVTLDRTYNAGEEFDLYVAYNGYPAQGLGFGSIMFRTRSGAYEVWTLSEPWYSYTWWPCKDANTDKASAALAFTVPDTLVVASNGVLQGVDVVGVDQLRYRWETNYPTAPYLYCFGATNYDTFGDVWTYQDVSMPLAFYIYPESNTPSNRAAWLATAGMLTVYSDLFGVYPFANEKYGICHVGFGGGMEHQTLTSQGGFGESLTAHELAHQWWGDNVTCATWHDIWLNEGFATYSEALWFENKPGGSEAALHAWMVNRRPSNVNGSVYCYDILNLGRIFSSNFSYRKGAWVLHMLRHMLGDETFFEVLAAYRAAFEGGAATTEDFRAVAESVSGRDLSWFFSEWVYDVGAPAYTYGWREYLIDGRHYVEFYIEQVQTSPYPVFTMPVDMLVSFGGGVGSGGTETHTVWNDAAAEHVLVEVDDSPVTDVDLDPKPWILWTQAHTVSFVEGPPKIVSADPLPGGAVVAGQTASIEIVFHKDVVVDSADLTLVGESAGTVASTFAYDAVRHAVTLTPVAPLEVDDYTLTVADSVVDVAASLALDGELVHPEGGEALPSGDGLPGGPAVVSFSVVRALGDVDCDGDVDFDDINPFVLALGGEEAYLAQYPACDWLNADCDEDGDVDFDDINAFVDLIGG